MSMSSLRPSDSLPAQLCNAGNERKCQDRLRPCGENVSPFPRQTNEQAVCPEGKYPNPEHQPPKKLQTSIIKARYARFGIWSLEFLWLLGFWRLEIQRRVGSARGGSFV